MAWESVGTIKGPKGDTGEKGEKGDTGDTGAATVILGSYDTFEELIAAHPTANEGDAFLVDGELFVWHND